jgi:hypothetical protein
MVRKLTHEKIHWLVSGSYFSIVYLKKLTHGPIFTVVIYQGYEINGYTFYTEQQDKKSTYQNSGIRADAYDATGQDQNMYYGQL